MMSYSEFFDRVISISNGQHCTVDVCATRSSSGISVEYRAYIEGIGWRHGATAEDTLARLAGVEPLNIADLGASPTPVKAVA